MKISDIHEQKLHKEISLYIKSNEKIILNIELSAIAGFPYKIDYMTDAKDCIYTDILKGDEEVEIFKLVQINLLDELEKEVKEVSDGIVKDTPRDWLSLTHALKILKNIKAAQVKEGWRK